jgi:hypothetical protein
MDLAIFNEANSTRTFLSLTAADANDLFEVAIDPFLKLVKNSFNPHKDNSNPRTEEEDRTLWELLMEADKMSVRQFLLS